MTEFLYAQAEAKRLEYAATINEMNAKLADAQAEIAKLRKEVVTAVHQGIAGATRAWQGKVDEANMHRDAAIIERDGAWAERDDLRKQLSAANAKLSESNIILRALAEAERLEDIALASQDAPNARQTWTAWQMQRAIASEMLRAWSKRNPQPA